MHKECIMDKGNSTSECSSRSSLRDRIIDVALDDFTSQGIRSVTMDEVATKLGISKGHYMRFLQIKRPYWWIAF